MLVLTFAVVGVSWFSDVVNDVRYHQSLSVSGGLGAHSDAVEDLARWLVADERRGGCPLLQWIGEFPPP